MTAPTMEQMLMELMSAHADFITAGRGTWDSALKRRNEALAAVLARFAELERERDAYRALTEQAETALRNCGCDMNADLIRREIAQRAGETG